MENGQVYWLKQVKINLILGGGFFYSKWVVGFLLYNSISYSVVFKFLRMFSKRERENWMNGGGHAKWLFEKIKKIFR